MKEWKIPVSWESSALIRVEANTLEEAMKIARDDDGIIPLPDDWDYVDGSWSLSEEDELYIREMYNGSQEDELNHEQ